MPTRSEVQAAAKTLAAARRDKEGITPDKKGSKKKKTQAPKPEPKKSKKGWIIGLCAAVALAGVGVGTYFLVTSLNKKTDLSKANILYEETNDGYKVTGIKNEDKTKIKTINIPSTYKGKPIVEIKEGALGECAYVEKITLPFIGRALDSSRLEGADKLFGYVFGTKMSEEAGGYTWQYYEDEDGTIEYAQYIIPYRLYSVTINGGDDIASGAFSACRFLESIHIKNNTANKVGSYAFSECNGLSI